VARRFSPLPVTSEMALTVAGEAGHALEPSRQHRHRHLTSSREHLHGKEGVDGSSPSEGSKDVIPICLTAVSSGDDDAAAAAEVFRSRLQEEGGHARA
jgi:hypothetical protein